MKVLVPAESRRLFAESAKPGLIPVFYDFRDLSLVRRVGRKLGFSSPVSQLAMCLRPESADLQDVSAWWFGASAHLPEPLTDLALSRMPSLRWTYVQRKGTEHMALGAFEKRSIMVSNAGNLSSRSVAEMIVTAIASHLKQLPRHYDLQKRARWSALTVRAFDDVTVGIIGGLGDIGTETARICRALGMTVTGTSRNWERVGKETGPYSRILHTFDHLPELLGSVDAVVLLVPLTSETQGFFGPEQLQRMKAGAALFNFGRAGLVQERAIFSALDSGGLSAYYTDFLADRALPSRIRAARTRGLVLTHNSSANSVRKLGAAFDQFMEGLNVLHDPARIPNRVI